MSAYAAGAPAPTYKLGSAGAPKEYTCQEIIKRADDAFDRFSGFRMLCQAIAELFYPERADFIMQRVLGGEQYDHLFDGEAVLLRRDLANQIGSMIRPRGQTWFKAKVFPSRLNKGYGVKRWMEDATSTMREIVYATHANFTTAMSQSDNDYAAFGTSVVTHTYLTDPKTKQRTGVVFKCLHLRDCAWYENNNGVVDEMYESIEKSYAQLADMFGLYAFSDEMRKAHEKDQHAKTKIYRCVIPRERFWRSIPSNSANWAVVYVHPGSKHELKAKDAPQPYFKTWPYLVRRWMNVSGEAWGRSPCTAVAMADARMLQSAQIAIIDAIEKLVNPPLLAPDEGVNEVSVKAGGVTLFSADLLDQTNGKAPVSALEVGRPDWGMQWTAERRMFLGRAFFQNLLKLPPIDGKAMTATEVNERIEEYLRAAAPIFEPMEAENGFLMEGVFQRAMDVDGPSNPYGAFEEPPDDLAGADIRFEFETPLSIAYRKLRTEQIRQQMLFLQEQVASGLNRGASDHYDWDEATRAGLEGLGPMEFLLDPEEVEAIRNERVQQQALTDAINVAGQVQASETGGKPPQLPASDPVTAALRGVAA